MSSMGPLWSGKIDLSNYKRRMHVRYGLRTNVRLNFESLGHHFLRHHFCWIFLFSCVVILHLISLTNLMISLRRKSREEIPHEKEFTSENIERDPPIPRCRQDRSRARRLRKPLCSSTHFWYSVKMSRLGRALISLREVK